MGQDCTEQQAYEVLLHLDETQTQGRKKGIVDFVIPGALAANDEAKPPTSENSPAKGDTVEKSSTVRREQAEMERDAKAASDATILQQAANMAVENALAARMPGYPQQGGITHSPRTPPPQAGQEARIRIEGMVNAFIAKHSLIVGGGFTQQMCALSTVSKGIGHTEIQARLLGYCWQHICDYWGQKNKNGKLFVACPRGASCKMKHDSPEQWNPVEQDVCVILPESYPNNQKKKLFEEPAAKAKTGPRRPINP